MQNYKSTAQSGFTLIELMIVVVILGILVAVALPSYQNSVSKSWRRKATACLVEMAQGMERRYTASMSYYADPTDPTVTTLPPQVCSTEDGMATYYLYTLTHPSPPDGDGFLLQAAPQGWQENQDARCGTLRINHQGVRNVLTNSTDAALVDECW